MHISSLVMGLATDSQAQSQFLAELSRSECFTVGEQIDSHLPVVLEVENEQEAERWFQWARCQPGVLDVNVVFVSWGET